MIIKGLKAIEKHMASLHAIDVAARPWYYESPGGANVVGDHDEDYLFDALYDVPNC